MAKQPVPPPGATINIWTGSDLVSFDGHTVTIQHVTIGHKSSATYSISQISGVQVERPSLTRHLGRFRILVAGELAPRRGRQSASRAAADPFVVVFGKKTLGEFEGLANAIRIAQARLHQPPAPMAAPAPAPAPAAPGLADQIQQLARLHAQGVLTDGEFQAAKARLLGAAPEPTDAPPSSWTTEP